MPIQTLDDERGTRRARQAKPDKGYVVDAGETAELRSDGGRKKKITISLSDKTMRALEEIKRATDADTDSEVFRNALRLHLALLKAHSAGVKLYMKRDGNEESVPVTLFVDSD